MRSKKAPTKPRKAKPSRSKAAGLVARLVDEKADASAPFTPEAREFIERVLEHNDTKPRQLRISRNKATDTLGEEFGIQVSPQTLERWVRTEFGRSSWGRK